MIKVLAALALALPAAAVHPGLATAAAPRAAASTDWSQLHGGPAHNGAEPGETILSPITARTLHPVWRRGIGYSGFPVVVSAGTVYAGTANAGTGVEALQALSAATGRPRWIRSGPGGGGPLAVVGGAVYQAGPADAAERSWQLRALAADTGALRWRVTLPGPGSSPTVRGSNIYLSTRSGCSGCGAPTLRAYRTTGVLRWSVPLTKEPTDAPASWRDRVYVPAQDGTVTAFSAFDGAPLWRVRSPGGQIFGGLSVAGGAVFVPGERHVLCALDADTGATHWCFGSVPAALFLTAAVSEGIVYASDGSSLFALDATTGAMVWAKPVGHIIASPAVANGVVYAVGGTNPSSPKPVRLYALNDRSGAILARVAVSAGRSSIYIDPTVSDGTVYTISGSELLTALRS